ncbi:MAG: UDP-4-amino-4,6-dideoxy-N-acetyl-beta-L-altrosamine transaminase [Epsilonproteobacteria bacterium]|nr:UDP-4-amino-4,6-dideoxy-N-acetyl-beta-L-altrosamine transaminase [Campylobacterota bacterium]
MIYYGKQTIDDDDAKAIVRALKSDLLTTGPKTKKFEVELAKRLGFRYMIAVSSGTAALHLSSMVLLNKNDKVITTPNSFLATANSIIYQQAKPVFIDICENGLLDLDLVEQRLKKGDIKALYAVTFSGLPFEDKKLRYLKEKYKIKILIDNAHYFGKDGGICDIATFSFHPVKHITTFEGGAIGINDKFIYEKLLQLRNHGIYKDDSMYPWGYEMRELGYNYRLSDVASAMGLSQLSKVDNFLAKRGDIAQYYHENLKKVAPLYKYDKNSSYHLFVARYPFETLDEKAKFFIKMREKGVALQHHYIPINSQPFYKDMGFIYNKKSFPQMHRYYLEAFSLPIYPTLSTDEQDFVIKQIEDIASI